MDSVQIFYFAWLRDRLGRSGERLMLPPDVVRVGDLIGWMRRNDPAFAALAADGRSIRVAVNQAFAKDGDPVRAGDEIAFFPPVTGG